MNSDDRTDDALVHAAKFGDGNAFGVMFERHRDRIFRHVIRLVDTPADAEDLVGLTFAEAWRKRASVRIVDGSLLPWLLVTATNLARNGRRAHHRHQALLRRLPAPVNVPDHSETVLLRVESRSRDKAVRSAFGQLSTRDRQILVLCVLEDLSTRDVAAALNVPAGTVKSRLARAKTRFADLVVGEAGIDELRSML